MGYFVLIWIWFAILAITGVSVFPLGISTVIVFGYSFISLLFSPPCMRFGVLGIYPHLMGLLLMVQKP